MSRRLGWVALGVVVAAVVISWWLLRPRDELVLRLAVGQPVMVPESDLSLTYRGIGHAMMVGGDCVPFISYAVSGPGDTERSIYDSLDGQQIQPWSVVAVQGEWGFDEPPTPWLERLYYRLFPADEPTAVVAVHLRRTR
jgi:hypothetical protein